MEGLGTAELLDFELRETAGSLIEEAHVPDTNSLELSQSRREQRAIRWNFDGCTAFRVWSMNHDGNLPTAHQAGQRRRVLRHAVFDIEPVLALTFGEAADDTRTFIVAVVFLRVPSIWFLGDLH